MNDKIYSSGNYQKYTSKNPIKRIMVNHFNHLLAQIVQNEYKKLTTPKSANIKRLNLLDMGCGEGFISNILFHNLPNCNITSIDFESAAIEKAKENNNKINFLVGNIYEIPFRDNYFDIVVCRKYLNI